MHTISINDLPPELKTLIFNDLETSLWSGRSVCKEWRDFLDSTPSSWETIYKQAGGNLSKLPIQATPEQQVSLLKRVIKILYTAKKNLESATYNKFFLKIPDNAPNPGLTTCSDKVYLLGKSLYVYDLSQSKKGLSPPEELLEGKVLAAWPKANDSRQTSEDSRQMYSVDHDTFIIKSEKHFELWDAQNEKKMIDVKDLKNDLVIMYKNILAYNNSRGQMTFFERSLETDHAFNEILKSEPVKGVSDKVSNKSLGIGARYFTLCQDGSLHAYDLEKKEKILNSDLTDIPGQPIENFKASEKYLAIWRKNATQVEVFDLKTQAPMRSFDIQNIKWGKSDVLYCPFQIYKDTLIGLAKPGIAVNGAKTIYCWDLKTGALTNVLQCEHDIQDFRIENGDLLIGFSSSCIYVWDLNTFQQLSKMVFKSTTETLYDPTLAKIQDGILYMPYWEISNDQGCLGLWNVANGHKLYTYSASNLSKSNFHYPPRITEQPTAKLVVSQIVITDFSVKDASK